MLKCDEESLKNNSSSRFCIKSCKNSAKNRSKTILRAVLCFGSDEFEALYFVLKEREDGS